MENFSDKNKMKKRVHLNMFIYEVAQKGNADLVEIMIQNGANVNAVDEDD